MSSVAYPHPFLYDAVPTLLERLAFEVQDRMVSNVLASAAVLRRHFRRLRSIGLLGSLTALGLVPLALYMPRSTWSQYTLLSLVCLYAGRKVVQYFKARGALKQLSMEEHFLRYGSSDRCVQKCIENDEHLWARSRILAALKAMAAYRMPSNLMVEEKKQRILRRYRRSFRHVAPRSAAVDLGLLAAITFAIVWIPTISVDMRAVMFQAGFLALAVAALSEVSHLMVNRHLGEGLERLYDTLSDWTVREGLEALSRSGAYSHELLYFAQPWFASSNNKGDDSTEASYVITGDGAVTLPASLTADGEPDASTL